MLYDEITLNHCFGEEIWNKQALSDLEHKEKVSGLKQEMVKKNPHLKWKTVSRELNGSAKELFNIKLKDILESAWKKYKEVQKYLGDEQAGNNEIFLVPLVEHTVSSEHHPKIELRSDGVLLGEINFTVHLKLFLSGVILKISQGNIQGVSAGKCKSEATVLCEGVTLLKDESREFEF